MGNFFLFIVHIKDLMGSAPSLRLGALSWKTCSQLRAALEAADGGRDRTPQAFSYPLPSLKDPWYFSHNLAKAVLLCIEL